MKYEGKRAEKVMMNEILRRREEFLDNRRRGRIPEGRPSFDKPVAALLADIKAADGGGDQPALLKRLYSYGLPLVNAGIVCLTRKGSGAWVCALTKAGQAL